MDWAPISLDDVPAWAILTNALAAADGTGEFYDAEDLAEELDEDGVDPQHDTWAVWDGDQMVAYGQVRVSGMNNEGVIRCNVDGGVLPSHRRRGIGRELLQRMEDRAVALSTLRHPDQPVQLRTSGQGENADVRGLLERRGYRPVRYFTLMRIADLQGATLPPESGVGEVRVVPVDASDAAQREAVRRAHADAFRDHWGSTEWNPQKWDDFVLGRPFRAALSRVAVAPDGIVLAFSLGSRYVDGEFYIGIVGSRRAARGKGLAKATLIGALHAARQAGFAVAELEVDSQNPTGALGLYESVGFVNVKTRAAYAKGVPPHTVE